MKNGNAKDEIENEIEWSSKKKKKWKERKG